MRYPVSWKEAKKLWPKKVAEARAALDASSSKKKALADKDLDWEVDLAVSLSMATAGSPFAALGLGGPGAAPSAAAVSEALRETDPQGYCDAKIASGEFMARLCCAGGRYGSSPFGAGEAAPASMVEAWKVEPQASAPSAGPSMYVKMSGAKVGGIHEVRLEGIYEKGSGADKQIVAVPADRVMLLRLDAAKGTAGMNGGFVPAAEAAFKACAPGGVFRYRNKPMRKWSQAEMAAFLSAGPKVWAHDMGAYGFGRPPSMEDQTVRPTDPVYADGAMDHPNPKPMGTAQSLGLWSAPAPAKKASP